jgi:hypothetical protein
MPRSRLGAAFLLISCGVTACSADKIVPQPSNITLEAALVSVANGLQQMKHAEGDLRTGLLAAEVEVTFNVTASATDANKLVVDISGSPAQSVTGTAKLGGEAGTTLAASRGNQIKIRFTNLLYADEHQLVFIKDPEQIKRILDILSTSSGPSYAK